jgi:hypothetical protein
MSDPCRAAGLLLAGLSGANCWTIAEHAGDDTPDGMQHLLARARWDHDAVREDLREYVVEHLGDPGAVLVVDLCRHRDYAERRPGVAWLDGDRRHGSRHSHRLSRRARTLSGGR